MSKKATPTTKEQMQAPPTSGDPKKKRKEPVKQSDVPRFTLSEALRIAYAIRDNYASAPSSPLKIASALELQPSTGHFRMLTGASSAYGLTEGSYSSQNISITALGKRIVSPTEEGMDYIGRREAFLKPRVINEFLGKYNGHKIPTDTRITKNVLQEMGVPQSSLDEVLDLIIKESNALNFLMDIKGAKYVNLENSIGDPNILEEEKLQENEKQSNINSDQAQPQGTSLDQVIASLPPINTNVFITHGKNKEILSQIKEIIIFGQLHPIVSIETESVSLPVSEKVLGDMRKCSAAIIHVGKETKMIDEQGITHIIINPNVLIEIGAALALFSKRFILLVEEGTILPSNLQGLYEVRYSGQKLDGDATMKLLKAFNEFKK